MDQPAAPAPPTPKGFVGAPGTIGAIGDFRLPARHFSLQRIDAPSCTAAVVELERDFAVSGAWYAEDVHYFDMSFIPRPSASRGCFEGVFSERMSYGPVFIAPAGYRLRGEGPPGCRQHGLNVFLKSQPLFPDEADLAEGLAPLLRDCLRFGDAEVRHTLKRIAAEVVRPGFASALLVEGLGLTLAAEAARALRQRMDLSGRKGGLPRWRMKLIEDRVRQGGDLGEGAPSLAELALLCGLSRRQLTRAFHQETGRSIGGYIQAHIVERAKQLLGDADLPIAEVGTRLGFASPAAFAAAFRRATGQSPRSFRARKMLA